MSPPHHTTTSHVDLSDAEMARVQAYADKRGLSVEQVVTQLAAAMLAVHYHLARKRKPAQVIQLVLKKNFSVTEKVNPEPGQGAPKPLTSSPASSEAACLDADP